MTKSPAEKVFFRGKKIQNEIPRQIQDTRTTSYRGNAD